MPTDNRLSLMEKVHKHGMMSTNFCLQVVIYNLCRAINHLRKIHNYIESAIMTNLKFNIKKYMGPVSLKKRITVENEYHAHVYCILCISIYIVYLTFKDE